MNEIHDEYLNLYTGVCVFIGKQFMYLYLIHGCVILPLLFAVLRKRCNQDICVKDHVVENDKNICNNRVKVANIDREEKIVQKHHENIVIEKKYIEIEIDFSEFQPFIYRYVC